MGAVVYFVDQELYARGDMKFAEFLILAKVGCPVGFRAVTVSGVRES
jgi:hypothetical protein